MKECTCDTCKCENKYCEIEMENFWGAPCYRPLCYCPYDRDITFCPYWLDEIDTDTCDNCLHMIDGKCDILDETIQKEVWFEHDCDYYIAKNELV